MKNKTEVPATQLKTIEGPIVEQERVESVLEKIRPIISRLDRVKDSGDQELADTLLEELTQALQSAKKAKRKP
jgi:hypothetical protein